MSNGSTSDAIARARDLFGPNAVVYTICFVNVDRVTTLRFGVGVMNEETRLVDTLGGGESWDTALREAEQQQQQQQEAKQT